MYYIDYRNGSMGHTIVAHALFSCNQIDVDPNILFSSVADAHLINHHNTSSLRCIHTIEHPKRAIGKQILSVTCNGWDEVLRKIFSYHKHYKFFPKHDNLTDFFPVVDPTVVPLEFLTLAYFDSYDTVRPTHVPTMTLGQYLEYNIDELKQCLSDNLGWSWDDEKGKFFHQCVLEKNKNYLQTWIDIQTLTNDILQYCEQSCNLDFWIKAVVISMVCKQRNIHPSILHWNEYEFLNNDTSSLIQSIKRV